MTSGAGGRSGGWRWGLCLITLVMSLSVPRDAHAYLDPGAGSMLVQLIASGAAGILIVLKIYWQRIKAAFRQRSSSIRRDS